MSIISRRGLLAYTSRFGALALLSPFFWGKAFARPARAEANLFKLGVASGEPEPDGVVLWTRLAPSPTSRRGGMANEPVEVAWEVAKNSDMSAVVRHDDGLTDHTVLVGISLRLGAPNMKAEDRRGATLDTPSWAIGRAAGWTLDVID